MADYNGTDKGNDFLVDSALEQAIDDRFYGKGGSDTIVVGLGKDQAFGGEGNDSIKLNADQYAKPTGPVLVDGGAGLDQLTLSYSWFTSTTFRLTAGNQTVSDALTYKSIESFVFTGCAEADQIFGSKGSDILNGAEGNDLINGNAGLDQIYGGTGSDTLNGGAGNDLLRGGGFSESSTRDVFVFDTALSKIKANGTVPAATMNVDMILDFDSSDRIHLDNAVFKGLKDGTLSPVQFHTSANGKPADSADRIIFNKRTGELFYDADGTGFAYKSILFAKISNYLEPGAQPTASDFLII